MSLSALRTAFSGMRAATTSLEVVATNVANAGVTGALPGSGGATSAFVPLTARQTTIGNSVRADVVARSPEFVKSYDPSSPDADADGMVASPAIDMVGEMTDLLMARISYKANLKVAQIVGDLDRDTVDRLT